VPGVRSGVLQEESPASVILLSLVTCGIYAVYWLYKSSEQLRIALNDDTIKPGMDILLLFLTCGIWGIYVEIRNVQKIHRVLYAIDPTRSEQANVILMMNVASLCLGFPGLIATYIVQEEFNALARASNS
jgi:hypothetical protein